MTGGSVSLRGHLSDFETTTSGLLRKGEARAVLNFAALFHETVFLTDTALGDHELIIKSFNDDGDNGLFGQIRGLGQQGVLRVLYRDRVIFRGNELGSGVPSLTKIFEGWKYRDTVEWGGDRGFTTVVPDDKRSEYFLEVEEWLYRNRDIITLYNPDTPKSAFRKAVLSQINATGPSTLLE